ECGGFFQIRVRFRPLALTPLNRTDCQIGFGLVRQPASGDLEFGLGALVIAVAIIIRETQCEMAFGKIRLQSQGLISVEASLLPSRRSGVGGMAQPALHPGSTRKY